MERFKITNKDTRKEFIEAIENNEEYVAQKPYGKGVNDNIELFDPTYGFYLKKMITSIKLTEKSIRRAYVLAKLSTRYSTRLALREMYYILGQTPEFAQEFNVKPKKLNEEMTVQLNRLEILANLDRIKFTISTASKGYIFYPFDYTYGNPITKIVFSEDLALRFSEFDMSECQSIIIVEKESAAQRLIEMGFLKLINATIITVSGEFNRGVFRFINRFANKYHTIILADGDVFGAKMISTIVMGSQRSRHLDLRNQDVHLAGLFPFVGDQIGLQNDKEEKRPLDNKWATQMLAHLKQFDLIDEQDIAVWEDNKTFELEALSMHFLNDKKELIGLGIYLTEFMRLKKIPVKPLPPDGIKTSFTRDLRNTINTELYPNIDSNFITDMSTKLQEDLEEIIDDWAETKRDEEYDEHEDDIKDYIDELDEQSIKDHLIKQYCEDMTIQKYDINKLSNAIINKAETTVTFNQDLLEEITEDIRSAIDELINKVSPKIEELLNTATVESNLELEDLDDIDVCDLYDKILEKIGAKTADAELTRTALKQRLGVE